MESILEMHGITKSFPGVKALDDVNLHVAHGEIHALVGENGAGKSTLMKVLSGVYPHGSYDGEIVFEGGTLALSGIADSEKRGIIIIHQELALVPLLSIAENIFLGNEISKAGVIDWPETNSRTEKLLRKVGLNEKPSTRVDTLGVGKQQLVEIAKALSKEVKLLILDEPTAALQENDSEKLLDLLLEFKAQGISSILISHKLNEVSRVADRITVLRDGRTVSTLDCHSETISEERIIRDMVGRDMLSRMIYGARVSMAVGLGAQIIVLLIGVPIGAIAGYMSGKVDNLLMRFVDVMYAFPQLLFVILIMAMLGRGLQNIFIAIGITGWVTLARVTRAEFLSLRETDHVLAARSIGAGPWRLITKHMMPNALTPIIVTLTFGIPLAIFTEASLSFIGVGISPPTPSWGGMVGDNQSYIRSYWFLSLFPAFAIALVMMAFTFFGDGLRDALDPRSGKK
jgi:ABC-type dipeptide/oligopeptide/nickel transport system permease subunit/ABC-type branched-subunit amino acid transport system ATPase component